LAGNVDNCFATFAVIEKMYSNSEPGLRVQQNVNTGLATLSTQENGKLHAQQNNQIGVEGK